MTLGELRGTIDVVALSKAQQQLDAFEGSIDGIVGIGTFPSA